MEYLAVYDISDPRRLSRVAKAMERIGIRVQKSVFECEVRENGLEEVLRWVEGLIDQKTDSVRFYPLFNRSRAKQVILGVGTPADFPVAYVV